MLQIGSLKITLPVLLAPMAGVTDHPFRVICRQFGVGVVYTEFVSANGVVREGPKTLDLVRFTKDERPIGIQIFGESPEVIAASAAYLAKKFEPDIIDLNFGCPVPKVTKKGAGSAMLRDLGLMREVVAATVEAVPQLPVTVKMRAGWDNSCIVATEAAHIIEEAGARAITLHPRTTRQSFTGQADWSLIKAVKQETALPVIGNGDIQTGDDALRMFDETGCDGVMLARGALGNPWIFREIANLLTGKPVTQVDLAEVVSVCRQHFNLLVEDKNMRVALNLTKKHFSWYIKGFPHAAVWRKRFMLCTKLEEVNIILAEFEAFADGANIRPQPAPALPAVEG